MLAINTAFVKADLALETNGKTYFKTLDAEAKHSENVLKNIDELCTEAEVDVLDVKTVAVVTGPGSFTGLRIGVAIAKALGCADKKLKFISLSSLELMAYTIAKQNLCKENFCCIINALSGNYFVAEFDASGKRLSEDRMVGEGELSAFENPFVLSGDTKFDFPAISLSAQMLLGFAKEKEAKGEYILLEDLLPEYIRPSQAEDNLKKSKKC